MSFTERDAIKMEMEELKEQTRRDAELYFESRKYRNERYTELLNRLRELDERDIPKKPEYLGGVAGGLELIEQRRVEVGEGAHVSLENLEKVKQELEEARKKHNMPPAPVEKKKITKTASRKNRASKERTASLIKQYLEWQGGDEKASEIQSYVEKEIGMNFRRGAFHVHLQNAVDTFASIKKVGHGRYKIDKGEDSAEE